MFVVLQCMAGDRGKDRIAYGPYLYALEPDILATLTIHGVSMQVLRGHIVKAIMHCTRPSQKSCTACYLQIYKYGVPSVGVWYMLQVPCTYFTN